jgi:hypothetical protein
MARTIYVPQARKFIDFSETATNDQINAYVRSKYPIQAPVQPAPPPAPPEEGIGALESGFYGSLGRLEAAGGKVAQAAGLESLADYLFKESRESEEYAGKYKPDIADISQIQGAGDVAKFAGSTVLQSLPETAVGIGGAYAGGIAGAAAGSVVPVVGTAAGAILGGLIGSAITSIPFFLGGNLQRQAEEQGIPLEDTSIAAAGTGAVAQAPIEAAFDILVARKLPGSGVAYDVAKKSFLREVATVAGTEGLTEPAQQAIELAQANPEKLLDFSPEVQFELLNAAAGGVLAGGIIGGGAAAVGRIAAPAQTPEQELAKTQLRGDIVAEQQQSRDMGRMAEINSGIEQFAAQPSIGQLKLNKIRIEPTKENKLRAPIERFQVTDFKGTKIAEFSDPVNAVDAVNRYQKIAGKKITLQNLTTGQELPTQTVKPGQPPTVAKTKLSEPAEARTPDISGAVGEAAGIAAVEPPAMTVQPPDTTPVGAPKAIVEAPEAAPVSVEPVAAPKIEPAPIPAPEPPKPISGEGLRAVKTFKTALGSEYTVYPDGGTTRVKTPHPGHPVTDVGLKPKSEKTYYIRPEDFRILDLVQATPPSGINIIAEYAPGEIGVKSVGGEYDGKFYQGRIVRYFDAPEIGLMPLEVWDGGRKTHFGNKIVDVSDPPISEPKPAGQGTVTEPAVAVEPIGVSSADAEADVVFVSPEEQEKVRKALDERIEKISIGVRSQLNKYGLKDVQTKFVPAFMDGLRFRATLGEQSNPGGNSVITIATGIYDPDLTVEQLTNKVFEVLNHESIHSLVTLGLLRENEMQMLFRAAENTKVPGKQYTYLDRAKAVYTPLARTNPVYQNPDVIREEAVAEMFRDWRLEKLGPPKEVRGLINRVIESVRSMFNNMRTQNYDDVFRDIESGVVGARERQKGRSRILTPGEKRVMAKPELPSLALSPEYPYEQRVPEVNAAQVNRVEHAVEYGAAINLIDRIMNSKTVRGATFFVPDVYRPDKNTWTRFVQNFADKMLPLGQFIDFIRQNGGTVPDALDAAMHEDLMRSRVGNFLADRERDLYKPLLEYLRDSGISLPEFEDYLYGLHAPERNERIRQINPNADPSIGSGMTDEEAASIVDAVDRDPRRNDFYAARDMFRKIIDDTNQLRVESGLTPDFDQQFVNDENGNPVAIRPYENYVPLRGFADESVTEGEVEEELRARVGQGFKIRGREDMRAFGRQSKASDLVAHAIIQNSEALIRAEKNKVGLSLVGLIEANPELAAQQGVEILTQGRKPLKRYLSSKGVVKSMVDPMYKNRDDVMVVKRAGEEIPIQIDNPFLQKALLSKKTGNPDIADKTLRFFQSVNRWLASVNTALNPEFMLINFPRDLQTALINISQYEIDGIKKKVLKDSVKSIRGVHQILRNPDTQNEWSDWYKMFLEDGGNTNGFFGTFTLADRLDEISKIAQDQSGSPKRRAIQAWEFVRDTLENMNGAFENAIRLSVYKNTIEAGVPRKRAAQIAKNLTVNFDKRGIYGPFLNSLYLFFNASVQGTFAMATAAGRSSKVRKAFGAMIVVGMMQDIINSLMSDEDEDGQLLYDKIPPYKLQSNLIIMDPIGLTETGYFSFPLPYGFNAFVNAGRAISRSVRGEYTTSQAATSIGSTFVDAFNPIGGTESLLNFIAPTTLDPLVALTINKDFTDRRIYPEPFPGSVPKANSQLYWTSTSPIFKNVTQFLNEATGGSEYVSGTIDMNPAVLEYIYDYFTGGLGAFVRRTYDTATNKIPEALNGDLAAIEANDFPLFRKLYGNVSERVSFEDYFDKVNHVLARGEEMKSAIKSGDPERIKSVRARFADELRIYPTVRALANRRNQLASQLRQVRENEKMPPELKRRRIEILQKQIEDVTGRVGKLYEENIDTGYPSLFS